MAEFKEVVLYLSAISCVAGFSIPASSGSRPRNLWQYKLNHVQEMRERWRSQWHAERSSLGRSRDIPPDEYMQQPMDHFDPQIKETRLQRFWTNTEYWNKPDGPVFLYIEGEAPGDPMDVLMGEHVDLAMKYGALIFAVDHRFYGDQTVPSVSKMRYLSSQQALSDLARFHQNMTEKYNLTAKNTWICFGGSYPGNLAAWFRVKYPHLVYGAVASSAPVRAKVDMQGYNNVVAKSLADPIVNGSHKCTRNIKAAFQKIDKMVASGKTGWKQLQKDFNVCQPFVSTPPGNQPPPNSDIGQMCECMTYTDDPYYNLRNLTGFIERGKSEPCHDISWATYIKEMKGDLEFSLWPYQTCTQFGYYQTCEANSNCIFSHYQSLDPYLEMCKEVFGFDTPEIYEQVDFENDYYGSTVPGGTRIVFINGSIDPWHSLSVLRSTDKFIKVIFIEGTSHCANMLTSNKNDPPQLRKARQMIDRQVGAWVQEATGVVVLGPDV